MQATVELSIYPLTNDYVSVVWQFIDNLKKYENIELVSNGLSTQVFGDYREVMDIITQETENIFEHNKAVLVMKVAKGILKLN
ncbi:MAG: YkoF family thiamine/hydroxymethylpyrimidine-binding protein [Cytophagales bacterium]|nr:YkoF family thiamine/hydroxymethylpyrimidine-binding protein [Cytophagales bacterium]